jgi:MFS superfamily sulfate permease-like transporter
LFRVESGIVYFNVEHIADTVLDRVRSMSPPPRVVICDLSTSPNIDMAGAQFFSSLHAELEKQGIALRIVEARSKVRDILRIEGVEEKVGRIDRFTTLADAVEAIEGQAESATAGAAAAR